MNRFAKQPSEEYTIAVDFTGRLPTGTALSTGTVAAIDLADDSDVSATVLGSTTATISGTLVKVLVKAGTDGKKYKITFLITLDSGEILEEDLEMSMKNF